MYILLGISNSATKLRVGGRSSTIHANKHDADSRNQDSISLSVHFTRIRYYMQLGIYLYIYDFCTCTYFVALIKDEPMV